MASTYSPNLRLELIGTGEQQGTWGNTTNTNLGTLLEQAIGGYISVTVTDGADTTLTTVNGGSDQSRNAVINLAGTLTATRNVICPAIQKVYIVKNATSGGFAVTFKVSGQTGVSIPNGATYILYVDGTDARLVTANLANQLANSVAITGGNITGLTNLAASNVSFTGGTMSGITSFASNSVAITGGNITGLTNLAASNVAVTGGTITGVSNVSTANLSASGTVSFTSTGAVLLPVGTTAQRPANTTGFVRFNSNTTSFEGYNGTSWGSLGGGGATGGGSDQVFYLNSQTVTTSYSIPSGQNANCVGPITINSGVTVTVPSNSRWVVL